MFSRNGRPRSIRQDWVVALLAVGAGTVAVPLPIVAETATRTQAQPTITERPRPAQPVLKQLAPATVRTNALELSGLSERDFGDWEPVSQAPRVYTY